MTKDPSPYQAFVETLEKDVAPEEKAQLAIGFMRESLSQKGVPRFRDFWEARKLFHDIFKTCQNPMVKAKLWEELGGLTAEARQIKEILDDRAKFAIEQIELAIAALGADVDKGGKVEFSLGKACRALQRNSRKYEELQGEIQFYTALFDRLKALRAEVIGTEMRVKQKNRLLKELTALGDRFIPERKRLIDEVSALFETDVRFFMQRNFEGEKKAPPHVLREEIKEMQRVAKRLSLSSKTFKESREALSKGWEELKALSEEKKAEYEAKKDLFIENEAVVKPVIDAFLALVKEGDKVQRAQIDAEHEKVITLLRGTELDGKVRHGLFVEVDRARDEWVQAQVAAEEKQAKAAAEEAEKKMAEYRKVIEGASRRSEETLIKVREELTLEGHNDLILELDLAVLRKRTKKGEEVFDDWVALEEMLREKVESLRKAMGKSGFDFGQAMALGEEMDQVKGWLDEVTQQLESL